MRFVAKLQLEISLQCINVTTFNVFLVTMRCCAVSCSCSITHSAKRCAIPTARCVHAAAARRCGQLSRAAYDSRVQLADNSSSAGPEPQLACIAAANTRPAPAAVAGHAACAVLPVIAIANSVHATARVLRSARCPAVDGPRGAVGWRFG